MARRLADAWGLTGSRTLVERHRRLNRDISQATLPPCRVVVHVPELTHTTSNRNCHPRRITYLEMVEHRAGSIYHKEHLLFLWLPLQPMSIKRHRLDGPLLTRTTRGRLCCCRQEHTHPHPGLATVFIVVIYSIGVVSRFLVRHGPARKVARGVEGCGQ